MENNKSEQPNEMNKSKTKTKEKPKYEVIVHFVGTKTFEEAFANIIKHL